MDKIKEFFGFGPVENYDDDRFEDDRPRSRDRHDNRREEEYTSARPSSSRYDREEGRDLRYESPRREPSSRFAEQPQRYVSQEPKYVPLRLSDYKGAKEVVDVAKAGDVVVFTLAGVERGEAARALDYVSGACRALNANMKKLSGVRNFILIPEGVVLSAEQLDTLAQEL